MSPSPPDSTSRPAPARSSPSWVGALRGVWLLTWRSQLTVRRLPSQLGVLLILPFLMYITIVSREKWEKRKVDLGDPARQLRGFAMRLDKENIPLQPDKREALGRILSEETDHGETTWREVPGETAEERTKRLKNHLDDWNSRILKRATDVLDEKQYAQFQTSQERSHDNVARRLGEINLPWTRTEPFYHWLIDFYLFIILPLTCVKGCGPLIRDELQADTLGFLVSRPVGRARLLIVKYCAQMAWLEIGLLAETLLLFAAGAAREVPDLGALLPLVLGAQLLAVPAFSALGLLLGQLTTRYMATALIYGAIVEMGIGRIPTNINTLSIIRHLQTLLLHNDQLRKIYSWPAGDVTTAICALVAAPVMFLSASALLFKFMEYHHAAEMQK